MKVAPFDENVNIGTFRLVFKAQESAAKERAMFSSLWWKTIEFLI